jgi:protein-tyrosine phosphatase/arsenate reductase
MNRFHVITIFCLLIIPVVSGQHPGQKAAPNPALQTYANALVPDFAAIAAPRRAELDKIADFIQQRVNAGQPVQLTYICTHNSRRSHFGQLWAAAAAVYYGIPNVKTFSGGTETSAFNPRAIAACERAGFVIVKTAETANPVYAVSYATDTPPVNAFSKRYDDAANPQRDFCAVMTCSQADQACPIVKGAVARIAVPYNDPKAFDGKPEETAKYDERCRQIATETFYVFSRVKPKV